MAVQELIKEFQDLKKTLLYPSSFKAVDECIDLCYAKLELEKQQIIDAVEWNYKSNCGEVYYNALYK